LPLVCSLLLGDGMDAAGAWLRGTGGVGAAVEMADRAGDEEAFALVFLCIQD